MDENRFIFTGFEWIREIDIFTVTFILIGGIVDSLFLKGKGGGGGCLVGNKWIWQYITHIFTLGKLNCFLPLKLANKPGEKICEFLAAIKRNSNQLNIYLTNYFKSLIKVVLGIIISKIRWMLSKSQRNYHAKFKIYRAILTCLN